MSDNKTLTMREIAERTRCVLAPERTAALLSAYRDLARAADRLATILRAEFAVWKDHTETESGREDLADLKRFDAALAAVEKLDRGTAEQTK